MNTGSTEESNAVKSFEANIGNFVLIVKNWTESAIHEPAFVKFNNINRDMFSSMKGLLSTGQERLIRTRLIRSSS